MTQIESAALTDELDRLSASDTDSAEAEQRFANRKTTNTPAFIDTNGSVLGKKAALINCIVKDTSSTGAMISLSSATARLWSDGSTGIPDRFTLRMPSDGVEIDCETAWRTESGMGVRFVSPARLLKRAPAPEPIAARVIPGAARTFGKRS